MKLKKYNKKTKDEQGSVFFETSIAITLFLLLCFFLVDISVVLSNRAQLSFETSRLVRDASVSLSTYQQVLECGAVEESLVGNAQTQLHSNISYSETSINAKLIDNQNSPYWTLRFETSADSGCIVLCKVLPFLEELSVAKSSVVENPGFECT